MAFGLIEQDDKLVAEKTAELQGALDEMIMNIRSKRDLEYVQKDLFKAIQDAESARQHLKDFIATKTSYPSQFDDLSISDDDSALDGDENVTSINK